MVMDIPSSYPLTPYLQATPPAWQKAKKEKAAGQGQEKGRGGEGGGGGRRGRQAQL
ncbi:uncharacterized protein P174DRAFT_442789 [Aspergillus novofumigatus IBT 16806]|uniref:Uncharacterized protein n=1 Tax=Aspergillus novofumigatus (strain IBT 16806) TaxID=1392255 RepID=A0A2I1C5G8_ASPN1|nr:uncharacterized protein P174DRAFT_442789 [Aspergillus novofumigatus IBT 16806]PKX92920.1 hypothetical protein P174DRAFT_442789 [Aspergillus novofumigatus IBT 16806]